MGSPAEKLLEKIAEFLVFRYYVLCPYCSSPNVLGADDRERESESPVCWSCRRKFQYSAGDVREHRSSAG